MSGSRNRRISFSVAIRLMIIDELKQDEYKVLAMGRGLVVVVAVVVGSCDLWVFFGR